MTSAWRAASSSPASSDVLELALARRVDVGGLAGGRVDPEQPRAGQHVQRQLQHPPALQLAGLLVADLARLVVDDPEARRRSRVPVDPVDPPVSGSVPAGSSISIGSVCDSEPCFSPVIR
jgi:hypothetical protein